MARVSVVTFALRILDIDKTGKPIFVSNAILVDTSFHTYKKIRLRAKPTDFLGSIFRSQT